MLLTINDLLQNIHVINNYHRMKIWPYRSRVPFPPTPDKDFKALSRPFTHYFGLWPKYPDPFLSIHHVIKITVTKG